MKQKTMGTLVKILVILTLSLVFKVQAQEVYNLTVNVEGAHSNEGQMFIAVYNTKEDFLDKTYKGTKSKIVNNSCTVTFEGLSKGIYAVSIFHDENDNGKMDTNFVGIPKEDYGCSNGASGFMGPPKWKDAKFELNENKTIIITL